MRKHQRDPNWGTFKEVIDLHTSKSSGLWKTKKSWRTVLDRSGDSSGAGPPQPSWRLAAVTGNAWLPRTLFPLQEPRRGGVWGRRQLTDTGDSACLKGERLAPLAPLTWPLSGSRPTLAGGKETSGPNPQPLPCKNTTPGVTVHEHFGYRKLEGQILLKITF